MKKFYIASQVRDRQRAAGLERQLTEKGFISVGYWLRREKIEKPLSDNKVAASDIAVEAVRAIADCSIFILLSDQEGTGIYVELGLALANDKCKKIYIVGEFGANSVFTYHPRITEVATDEELISLL